jgi:cytochrome bd-type quinol oxidase subunit 2
VDTLRADVAAFADTVATLTTVATIVLILVLLYFAFLNWVLHWTGTQLRRRADGPASRA